MSERDWSRRGRVDRVVGDGAKTTVYVTLARVGVVGPLQAPLSACWDIPVAGGPALPTRVRVGDGVVVADVGATPDAELLVIAVYRS